MNYQLGDKVTVLAQLERTQERTFLGWSVYWKPIDLKTARTGIVIGTRRYSNGIMELGGAGPYRPKHYFKVYLVVFDIHRNPVPVRAFDMGHYVEKQQCLPL